ncbi:PKD domain-containing protein, partial [Zhongshania sp.]|uniref:PKD domain-containing protein n=1 Tax=Zhongshania sp. TaxID=1971902 RepID=UPI00356222CC
MQNVKKWRVTFVIFFAVMLAACGGGGGSNGAATPGAGSSVNNLPIANAGVDQNIVTGAFVTLDGSASSDADGDSLSYLWSISSKPGGSSASLSDNAAAMPQ